MSVHSWRCARGNSQRSKQNSTLALNFLALRFFACHLEKNKRSTNGYQHAVAHEARASMVKRPVGAASVTAGDVTRQDVNGARDFVEAIARGNRTGDVIESSVSNQSIRACDRLRGHDDVVIKAPELLLCVALRVRDGEQLE